MHKLRASYGALALIVLAGCRPGLSVDDTDKAMLLRAGDLAEFGYGFADTERFETWDKTRYFDGSYDITYEFETPDSEEDDPLYLSVTATFEKNSADALVSYGVMKTSMKYGLKSNDLEVREIPGFFEYGDASEFHLLEMDGYPVGNLFAARKGTRVYTLVMSGMYFDDSDTWKDVLRDKLRRFEAYKPGK
jgi:hypothetical protein